MVEKSRNLPRFPQLSQCHLSLKIDGGLIQKFCLMEDSFKYNQYHLDKESVVVRFTFL